MPSAARQLWTLGIRVIQLSVLVLQAVFLVLLEQFLRIAFRCHILPLQAIDGRLIDIVDHLRIAQLRAYVSLM